MRRTASRLAATIALAAMLAAAGVARADAVSPAEGACQGKPVGEACAVDDARTPYDGGCAAATCARPDYGSWDRDASNVPPTTLEPCVVCRPGAPLGTAPADGGAEGASSAARAGAGGGGCAVAAITTGEGTDAPLARTWLAIVLVTALPFAARARRRPR